MRQDADTLKNFYASPLGQAAGRLLSERVAALWPNAKDMSLLGFGYALPVLEGRCGGARRVIAAMPAQQGVEPWSFSNHGNASVQTPEDRLPFDDQQFDRAIVLHGLEEAGDVRGLLRELWRVTAEEGRILIIAANRRGLWSRADNTPFGDGRPWTRSQLAALLEGNLFQVSAWAHALYMPPMSSKLIAAGADTWERAGETLFAPFGGVVMVEAVKRLYIEPRGSAPAPVTKTAPARPLTSEREKS